MNCTNPVTLPGTVEVTSRFSKLGSDEGSMALPCQEYGENTVKEYGTERPVFWSIFQQMVGL